MSICKAGEVGVVKRGCGQAGEVVVGDMETIRCH